MLCISACITPENHFFAVRTLVLHSLRLRSVHCLSMDLLRELVPEAFVAIFTFICSSTSLFVLYENDSLTKFIQILLNSIRNIIISQQSHFHLNSSKEPKLEAQKLQKVRLRGISRGFTLNYSSSHTNEEALTLP